VDLVNLGVNIGYILIEPDENAIKQNRVDVVKSHDGRRQRLGQGCSREEDFVEGASGQNGRRASQRIFSSFRIIWNKRRIVEGYGGGKPRCK